MVSYDGSYQATKDTYKVVNQRWLEASDANEYTSLAKYTFALKGFNFVVFGKATLRGQTEAEMTLWRQTVSSTIEQSMGSVSDKLGEEDSESIVILPATSKTSQELVSQIKTLIFTHRITESSFSKLLIFDEKWLHKTIETGEVDVRSNAAVVRDVFKMFVQNDTSVFWQDSSAKDSEESPA